jgi:hypothetical protein
MSGSVNLEKLKKRDFQLLGAVFEREISGLLPAQIVKSKAVVSLEERGYITPMTIVLPGVFPVTVKGWELTELGRMTYCANCSEGKDNQNGRNTRR